MTASPVLVPHAGVHSAPNTPAGPADFSCIFAPQGHPIHPGLVSLPGSASVLESPVVVFSSDREPYRRALSPKRGRGGTFEPQARLRLRTHLALQPISSPLMGTTEGEEHELE